MNHAVTLASRPTGFPSEENFALVEREVPSPGPGEVLVRIEWTSCDPYQRGRMSEARSYAQPVAVGDVMTAQSVGEVVESQDERFPVGATVLGQLGWQEYAVARGGTLRAVPDGIPPQWALHVLGTNGLTAWFGLYDVGLPRVGDTVVVSAAHGGVGQLVGQLAKLAGCRAVGIAGGPEKVRDLTETFGYDAGVDYKDGGFRDALKAAVPDGVDVYFDNVGGDVSAAVHARLNVGARIAICGQVSQYNLETPQPTFHPGALIVSRARMEGFLVTDYAPRFGEALPKLARLVLEGRLRHTEDVVEGIENAPAAFLRMLRGENRGKQLVRVLNTV